MAINLTKELPNGISITYWVLAEAHYVVSTQEQVLKVAGYLNEQAYLDGKAPVLVETVVLKDAFANELTQGVIDACYAVLAELPEWQEAE